MYTPKPIYTHVCFASVYLKHFFNICRGSARNFSNWFLDQQLLDLSFMVRICLDMCKSKSEKTASNTHIYRGFY